ncbi:MAG TPA: hypothetical protein VNB24_02400 [Acidimicrobiales bacterium]|nr:hypothetical protein [Acidimicrobiales bacterium]
MATTTMTTTSGANAGRGAAVLDRARARWANMAGRLGLGFSAVGFLVILKAWDGAAGLDYSQGQLPYLLSGGGIGVGLIIIGAAVLVSDSHRRDRVALEAKLDELLLALDRPAAPAPTAAVATTTRTTRGMVIAGRSSFHKPNCRLVAGRDDGEQMSKTDAVDAGLTACRVCNP